MLLSISRYISFFFNNNEGKVQEHPLPREEFVPLFKKTVRDRLKQLTIQLNENKKVEVWTREHNKKNTLW